MQIKLLAIGPKMPDWVEVAFKTYQKRLSCDLTLSVQALPLYKRHKNTPPSLAIEKESQTLLNALKPNSFTIALDSQGSQWSSEDLAKQLRHWTEQSNHIQILIGGPDGMNPACLNQADVCWSLSPLTLPHPLVRIIVAEQLYRAVAINKGLPYHR